MLQAFILGLVQGVGELLPISSSAHLIVVPWLFHWRDPGLGFDVALHLGTLLAVLVYFWRDVWLIIKGLVHSLIPAKRDWQGDVYQRLAWLLALASVPGAAVGFFLEKQAETNLRSIPLVATTMLVFGSILYWADKYSSRLQGMDKITPWQALLIGCSQALAIIPGISRSGSTMTTGLFLGLQRQAAARFSFLLSLPIVFGAGLLKLGDLHSDVSNGEFIMGFFTAAVSGFLAIQFLMRLLVKNDFKIFVWYRLVFAALIFCVYFFR